jgi:RNA polymerase sigma factor (sigma-70 family)
MKRNKLVRRMVTNEEFNEALKNKDNEKIIKAVLARYYHVIPADKLKDCGYDALWRCLGYHIPGKGNKFTTSLWKFTTWECRRALKRIHNEQSTHTINISTIETKEKFDIPMPMDSESILHLRECLTLLNTESKQIIHEYYFEHRTMQEIGELHGYSKEAARQKINKAVRELRKRYTAGV